MSTINWMCSRGSGSVKSELSKFTTNCIYVCLKELGCVRDPVQDEPVCVMDPVRDKLGCVMDSVHGELCY